MRRVGILRMVGSTLMAGAALWPTSSSAATGGPRISKVALTASAETSAYDATVHFAVTVTAAGSTPNGTVTFSDSSNGSVLDSMALVAGEASFATASLVWRAVGGGHLSRQRHVCCERVPAKDSVSALAVARGLVTAAAGAHVVAYGG